MSRALKEVLAADPLDNRLFTATFNQAAVGMAHVSLDGTFILVNKKFCEITGFTNAELVSLHFYDITHPDDLNLDQKQIQQLSSGEIETYSLEKRYIQKNGSVVWVNLTASLVRNSDGVPQCFIAVIEDIAIRKAAEAALRALHLDLEAKVLARTAAAEDSARLLKQEVVDRYFAEVERNRFFAISQDAMTVFHTGCTFLRVNPSFVQLIGYSEDELMRLRPMDLTHPEDRARTLASGAQFRTTNFLSGFENRYIAKNGSSIHFSWTASLFPETSLVYAIGRDVTEAKRLEKIREAERQKAVVDSKMHALGRMAAAVAHEINNPLTVVYGQAYQLKKQIHEGIVDKENITRCLLQIEQMSSRIVDIVNGLNTFARDGSKDAFAFVSLKKILDETLAFCRSKMELDGVALTLSPMPTDALVHCRSVQISQVILNFLNNAQDSVEGVKQKKIHIEFLSDEKRVGICVQDNGSGVAEAVKDRVFEPFFSTKAVGRGTGLGLSISKGIIEDHHGEIFFENQEPAGARFMFLLPKVT